MEETTQKKLLKAILVLSLLGLIISLYQTYDYYTPSDGSFCDFSATISCSAVTKSSYARILTTPVAILGVLYFLILALLSRKAEPKYFTFMYLWSLLGTLFIIYLIYAEIQLGALCPLCTLIHLLIITIAILASQLHHVHKSSFWSIPKPWFKYISISLLLLLIIFNFIVPKPNQDALAKCLAEKGVIMYSSYLCSHCQETKDMFGTSMKYINQIECHPTGPGSQTQLCQQKQIEGTPTWTIEQQGQEVKRYKGFLTLEQLREFAGC